MLARELSEDVAVLAPALLAIGLSLVAFVVAGTVAGLAGALFAIVAALAACTPRGATLLSISGPPYDTLRNAICDAPYCLVGEGIVYREIALSDDGTIDLAAAQKELRATANVTVFIQRSRGYAPRRSLSVAECEAAYATVKSVAPNALVLVDNCYGELVEEREPAEAGGV